METCINHAAEEESHDTPRERPRDIDLLSINEIFRKHSRDRLFVHPLHWTSQHLGLLECRFARINAELNECQHSGFPESLRLAASELTQAYMTKSSIVRYLIEGYNLRRHRTFEIPFRFGGRVVASLETDGVFSPVSPNTGPPRLAYLDLEATQLRRDNSIAIPRGRRHNGPVIRMQRKRRRLLQPSNKVEDPYIAAILIALGQAQCHQNQTPQIGIEVQLKVMPYVRVAS